MFGDILTLDRGIVEIVKIVDNRDGPIPLGEEPIDKVRSDKSGTTSYQNVLLHRYVENPRMSRFKLFTEAVGMIAFPRAGPPGLKLQEYSDQNQFNEYEALVPQARVCTRCRVLNVVVRRRFRLCSKIRLY